MFCDIAKRTDLRGASIVNGAVVFSTAPLGGSTWYLRDGFWAHTNDAIAPWDGTAYGSAMRFTFSDGSTFITARHSPAYSRGLRTYELSADGFPTALPIILVEGIVYTIGVATVSMTASLWLTELPA